VPSGRSRHHLWGSASADPTPDWRVPIFQAVGPAREPHLQGLTPEQIAAIVTQRGTFLEEER